MDSLVNDIQNLSGRAEDLKRLLGILNQTKTQEIIISNYANIQTALAALTPGTHTLGCIYLLGAFATYRKQPLEVIDALVRALVLEGSIDQIRMCPDLFCTLVRAWIEQNIERRQAIRCILVVEAAVAKLKHEKHVLTPLHADLNKICLLAKCYNRALPMLNEDIYKITPEKTSLRPVDFLLCYYYGGMIHIGCKQYK
eukprot:Colp12_sorted_trinity150504_noHs@26808